MIRCVGISTIHFSPENNYVDKVQQERGPSPGASSFPAHPLRPILWPCQHCTGKLATHSTHWNWLSFLLLVFLPDLAISCSSLTFSSPIIHHSPGKLLQALYQSMPVLFSQSSQCFLSHNTQHCVLCSLVTVPK